MEIAFIVRTGYNSQILHIKINPNTEDITVLEEICKAIGDEDCKLIHLQNEEILKLKQFV